MRYKKSTLTGQNGVLGRLATWFFDTYLSDAFVSREDFDHVQDREFPIVQRDMANLRAHRDSLLEENHKLVCLGLHHYAFLPILDDAAKGQVNIALTTFRTREQFSTRVCLEVSDEYRRETMDRLRPQVLDYFAKVLTEHTRRLLYKKFSLPFPETVEKRNLSESVTESDSASFNPNPKSVSLNQGRAKQEGGE